MQTILLTKRAQDYTPTPQDHSLNTYGITPHAAVKQPIYKNSWRWTCKCPKHVEAIFEKKIIVKLFASSWYIFLTYIYDARSHLYKKRTNLSIQTQHNHPSRKFLWGRKHGWSGRVSLLTSTRIKANYVYVLPFNKILIVRTIHYNFLI